MQYVSIFFLTGGFNTTPFSCSNTTTQTTTPPYLLLETQTNIQFHLSVVIPVSHHPGPRPVHNQAI